MVALSKFRAKHVVVFTILVFGLTAIAPGASPPPQNEAKGVALLEEGERLFKNLEAETALEKFRSAFPYLRTRENLLRFYLDISQAYYALGDEESTKKMLRKMLEIDRTKDLDPKLFPKGFHNIYLDVRIEFPAEAGGPGAMGSEGKAPAKKKSIWPFIIGGAVVVAGVLAYLIVSKKKSATTEEFTLTVTKGTGVLGSPNSGTYTYKKGEIASYNYSLELDYLFYDLVVKLDGNDAPPAGNITMDRNHTLSASVWSPFKKK